MSTSSASHVCVVGAGIVGSATAYALARDGWQVTLLDALPAAGHGASLANGAQLSYSYVEPLATPAALRALPAWLLTGDSPIRWRPRARWAHWRWLFDFVRACRPAQVHETTEALLALSSLSSETLRRWLAEIPDAAATLQHRRPGKLVLYRDEAARAGVQRQLAWQRALGCRQRLVDADECVAIEPALAVAMAARIAFGVWTDSEEVIDGAALAAALAKASGADSRFGERVTGFEREDARLAGVRLTSGDVLAADHIVLATGSAAPALVQPLGLRLPIEPIKGYSLTLPVVDTLEAPCVSVTDAGRKIVFARLGETLRVAGFAELVGDDLSLVPARLDALRDAVQQTFPGACDLDRAQPWAGLRPATPDGRPRIGATACPNLWLNVGHGPLGLTLAAGSAVRLAAQLRSALRSPRGTPR